MSKFWAVIVSNHLNLFDCGQHEDFDHAISFASSFCDRKNEENQKLFKDALSDGTADPASEPEPYELIHVVDNDEYRRLVGVVLRPYVIAREKREAVGVDVPVRHGGEDPADGTEVME